MCKSVQLPPSWYYNYALVVWLDFKELKKHIESLHRYLVQRIMLLWSVSLHSIIFPSFWYLYAQIILTKKIIFLLLADVMLHSISCKACPKNAFFHLWQRRAVRQEKNGYFSHTSFEIKKCSFLLKTVLSLFDFEFTFCWYKYS